MKFGSFLALAFLALSSFSAADGAVLVHLRGGAEIEAKTQTANGDRVTLVVNQGTIEIAAKDIQSIETVPETAAPATSQKHEDILSVAEALLRASEAQALPTNFVKTVANVESGMRADAVSPKGAVGLMQLMPATAGELGVKADSTGENALGGAMYLRQLLIRYNGDARLALAAYNAGPAAVDRYRGIPPYPETVAYVNKVLAQYARLEKASRADRKVSGAAR